MFLQRIYWQDRSFKSIYEVVDRVPGWLISPVEEYCLYRLARRLEPESIILEIGSWKGRSTCCLGLGCAEKRCVIYAIDVFLHLQEFKRNIESCNLQDMVVPVQGKSDDIAIRWTLPVDFLFIDGGHEYRQVLADFKHYFSYVVSGGLVALHDVSKHWPGPSNVWIEEVEPKLENRGAAMSIRYGVKP